MTLPGWTDIARMVETRGHAVFSVNPPHGIHLNIVALRSPVQPKGFDDLLCVFYRDGRAWTGERFRMSTEPSSWYLDNPGHPRGTARLLPGQYRCAYRIGVHKPGSARAHLALCQHAGDVAIERYDPEAREWRGRETGRLGINIHMIPEGNQPLIDGHGWSAGCQVFAPGEDFARFMALCDQGRHVDGGLFTYTLLDWSP